MALPPTLQRSEPQTGGVAAARRWLVDSGAIVGARDVQEDYAAFATFDDPCHGSLLILADGMGGHVSGERASRTAVDAFNEDFVASQGTVPQRLEAALYEANQRIAEAAKRDLSLEGMGCTLVAAYVDDGGLHWVSVGDSPLWLWRGGRLRRLNEDHSLRAVLDQEVARGKLRPEDAENDPRRHSLLSALTGGDIGRVDLPLASLQLKPGDVLVLASDGLLTLSEARIAEIIGAGSADTLVPRLLAEVERAAVPRQDNCTVLMAASRGRGRSRWSAVLASAAATLGLGGSANGGGR